MEFNKYNVKSNSIWSLIKGISPIKYNSLILPVKITWDDGTKIENLYAADGAKMQVMHYTSDGTMEPQSRYYGGFEYEYVRNTTSDPHHGRPPAWIDQLTQFPMSEGRVTYSNNTFSYEYQMKDHFGNVRTSFVYENSQPTIKQEDYYYPFGLSYRIKDASSANRYLYNGKEQENFHDLNWYDYGARSYDPQLGRWHVVDPADQTHAPYYYCGNNPIMFIDPSGCELTDFIDLKNGNTVHIEDGVVIVRFVNDADFQKVQGLSQKSMSDWSTVEKAFYSNLCQTSAALDWNSDLGKMIRVVFAEMSTVGKTSNADRQIVAESISNRKKSGEYGDTYNKILTPGQYNAMKSPVYKEGPYAYLDLMEGKLNSKNYNALQGIFLNTLSVSYNAKMGIGEQIGHGVVSYVSYQCRPDEFDRYRFLINVTNQIQGLQSVVGVWARK